MATPARPPIPRGLTSNTSLGLVEALHRCLSHQMVLFEVAEPNKARAMRTVVHLLPGTDRYTVAQIPWGTYEGWSRDATRLTRDLSPQARAKVLSRRRGALHDTLNRFHHPGWSLFAAIDTVPFGSLAPVLAWLWWTEQVAAGAPPETAWMLTGLRVPTVVMQRLRFDPEAGVLHCLDRTVTLFAT